jgi:hypothetical protein
MNVTIINKQYISTTTLHNQTPTAHIGGIPHILPYLSIYVPYSVLTFLSSIIGFIGKARTKKNK